MKFRYQSPDPEVSHTGLSPEFAKQPAGVAAAGPLVDLRQMHELMGDEAGEFSEIVNLYLDETRHNLKRLDTALASGDRREIEFIAHNCAGTSATCGMAAVAIPFRELEIAGRSDRLEIAPAALAEAHRLFGQTEDFLAQHLPPTVSAVPLRH